MSSMRPEEFEKIAHEVARMVTQRYMDAINDSYEKTSINTIAEFYTDAYIVAKAKAQSYYATLNKEQLKDESPFSKQEEHPKLSPFQG